MRRAATLTLALACAGLGACSRDLDTTPGSTPTTLSLQLYNGGATTAFVYESCIVDFTVTSLADPTVPITRVAGCLCQCGQAQCPVCGPCFEGPREIAAGTTLTEYWITAHVTVENSRNGGCQRLHSLPDGSYRIVVPIYASEGDATAKTAARLVAQTFTLPVAGDTLTIPVAASP